MITVIPAYCPDKNLPPFVKKLKEDLHAEIIMVNDGSPKEFDRVFEECERYATILTHEKNKGKGRAMKTAIAFVKENMPKEDGIVFCDADGQHKIEDIKQTIEQLKKNPKSLILGVRDFKNDVPAKSMFGNKLTSVVFRLVSGVALGDTQTGLRAIGKENFARALMISGERYEYEMNMLLCFAREKIPFVQVPIQTIYIDQKNSTSHFNAITDSIRIYGVIFKFMGSSLISALIDYLLFLLFLFLFKNSAFAYKIVGANVTARIISATVNYNINKHYVFESGKIKTNSAVKYFLLALVILGLNTAILYVLTNMLSISPPLAKPIVEVFLFVLSFTMQNRFVFSKNGLKK